MVMTDQTGEPAVLVIDDEESMREGCRQTLEEEGYRAMVARDGRQGLAMVKQSRPSIVLVDLKMPGMDGMEVIDGIRRIDRHIVTIVITGYGTTETAVAAMRKGVFDYLTKPFGADELLRVVAGGLEKYRFEKYLAWLESERGAPPAAPSLVGYQPALAVEVAAKALSAEQLSDFVSAMIADRTVIGPTPQEGAVNRFRFASLKSASQMDLGYDVTILPPKKYVLPASEALVEFKLDGSPAARAQAPEVSPAVLIGIHPYDMIAMNQLDHLMSETNQDPNYVARRNALTIIGVDPVRASEKAFWGTMGCHVVEEGFDLWLTDVGGAYVVQVGTDKGARLLEQYTEASDATEQQLRAWAAAREGLKPLGTGRQAKFYPADLPGVLRRSFDSPLWAERASKCLSCGSCNLVCPTCYCFDVRDDVDLSLKTATRYRTWDGCLLEDFAKIAGNENFRKQRLQRYRHRFYRKGMYLYDKHGYIACVGCGRCATACLPDIADPVTVYDALTEGNER